MVSDAEEDYDEVSIVMYFAVHSNINLPNKNLL